MKKQIGYEKLLGKALKGGDYSEIYYYNNDNEACEAGKATHCVIYEREKNGKLVHTIYAYL
ncbi:MAG: hypothetical protein J6A95_05565 [Clostridia bacterium]|nr:hypothetical protein [Clostridia bacterium]